MRRVASPFGQGFTVVARFPRNFYPSFLSSVPSLVALRPGTAPLKSASFLNAIEHNKEDLKYMSFVLAYIHVSVCKFVSYMTFVQHDVLFLHSTADYEG